MATNVTRNLATPLAEAGVQHQSVTQQRPPPIQRRWSNADDNTDTKRSFDTLGPQYQAFPEFLRVTNHRCPEDDQNTAFHYAYKTSKDTFGWFTDHPENLKYFNDYMALRRDASLSWLAVYPLEKHADNLSDERALFVNIGGGVGHQCAEFKAAYPKLPGRVILEDLPHTIEKALPTPGVENLAHNFYEPQPIKGEYSDP